MQKKSAGRSGMQIIVTHDQKFIVKEITSVEKNYLLKLSHDYYNYVYKNEFALLAKIYGLFSLRVN